MLCRQRTGPVCNGRKISRVFMLLRSFLWPKKSLASRQAYFIYRSIVVSRDVAHISHDGSLFIPQPIACIFLLVALMALLAVGMPPSSCIYILLPLYTASVAYNASGISLKKSPLSVRISLWFYRLRGESFSRHSLSAVKLCSTLVSIGMFRCYCFIYVSIVLIVRIGFFYTSVLYLF